MNIGLLATALGVIGVIVGYGIWVGRISQRVSTVEEKQEKLENKLETKLDKVADTVNELALKIVDVQKDIQYLTKDKK